MEIRHRIEAALSKFGEDSVYDAGLNLFEELGYNTSRRARLEDNNFKGFSEMYIQNNLSFSPIKAMTDEWSQVELLFQLSEAEMHLQLDIFDTEKYDNAIMESYVFFAIELTGFSYTRGQLAQITREVNKLFPMPVMILFKHKTTITIAVINRRLHKRDENKDVLEKVTLIKDIWVSNPHRAHIEILVDLSFKELHHKYNFSSFVMLHDAWSKCLDTKELNKRFYLELANWYFWAMDKVKYPDDIEKNGDIRNATSLIRLITRVIFIWFIKEKGMVPDQLFNENTLKKILKDFKKNGKSHSYYQAILQNLFFGTLNQKMNERAFVKDGSFTTNKNEYGVKNLFRYADKFSLNESEILDMFKEIPFLNGGLFDCLDKPDDNGKVQYVDGFSRNPKKQAIIADSLFFGDEQEVDLNDIYGTRNKTYKVKGLVKLLDSYKFTVTENTPLEEEIALDPELLGKVFENLLASYNPETQTTARKQTGSFYTPREIVNYMVDESLLAYLQQKLEEAGCKDIERQLRDLLGYNETEISFNEQETKVLIQAIDNCKILDPACGSGAFPMGVLHKLVHVLHKLDPHNERWKERQKAKANNIDDPNIRQHTIEDIEDAFTSNELDYGRKLYLIENCIYGVDIQPIAVQIAKLRFFISLIIDQKKQPSKENLGIRSLPNLETKFVSANTLIELENPEQLSFKNPEIDSLENKVKQLRHQYFNAKNRKEKLLCQQQDKTLRQDIAKLLISEGWGNSVAQQIADFDPYEQNASAPFFDSEWMFGLRDGFDVVIGNPPYIDSEAMVKLYPNLRELICSNYETTRGNWDYYIAFYEKAFRLLSPKGYGIYITPNKWLSAPYGKELRKYFRNHLVLLCNCSKIKVFEAGNTPVISSFIRNRHNKDLRVYEYTRDWQVSILSTMPISLLKEENWGNLLSPYIKLLNRLKEQKYKVAEYSDVENPFSTAEAYVLINILEEGKNVSNSLKLINTGTIDSFKSLWGRKKTSYLKTKYDYPIVKKNQLKETLPRRFEQQSCEKIIITGMRYFECYYDYKGEYLAGKSTIMIKNFKNKGIGDTLTAILNSSLISFYLKESFSTSGIDGGINFSKNMVEEIPVPEKFDLIPLRNLSPILSLLCDTDNDRNPSFAFFIKLLYALIYELYLQDEVASVGANVLCYLENVPNIRPLMEKGETEKALEAIEKVYLEISDPKHPVSIAMAKMHEIEEVKIIEGNR